VNIENARPGDAIIYHETVAGTLRAIHGSTHGYTVDVRWHDGSVSTAMGIEDMVLVKELPDRGDPVAVERWLASGGPAAP
jgi:hypothetical protein